jgi:glycosyltransferase involved in cell wall biosynthesis
LGPKAGLKIGIYSSTSAGASIGGAEYSIGVLAEALGQSYEVEIVHHSPSLTAQQVEKFFDVDLSTVRFRYVEPEPNPFGGSHGSARRYQEAREWQREVSYPYELFINFTHHIPPFCHARMGVLIVLFPFYNPVTFWPFRVDGSDTSSVLWRFAREFYYNWEWKRRMASYALKLTNSGFTARWTRTRWGIKSHVLYPPVDVDCQAIEKKENLVLSVGRFTPLKKHLEMAAVFTGLNLNELGQWTWICAGTVADSADSRTYYEKVARYATSHKVRLTPDIDRLTLKQFYESSKIFWHAAGLDEDDSVRPELSEHFGMATVEAMAAGCVPVVINKGGQREIIDHGVNGFLWNTVDELRDYTKQLAKNETLRLRMSAAARLRARDFSRENFVAHFRELVESLVSKRHLWTTGGFLPPLKQRSPAGV